MGKDENKDEGRKYQAGLRAELDGKLTLLAEAIERMHDAGRIEKFEQLCRSLVEKGMGDVDERDANLAVVGMFADVGFKYAMLQMVEDVLETGGGT